MARKRYLIIGDGAAGVMAAQTLRTIDSNARIAILSDDPHPGYFRAALTNYLLGELREDQLWAVPPDFYTTARVSRVFCRVVALDTARSQVWEASGAEPIPYDALLVASGARPRAADFPGAHLRGIHTMRTIVDVRQIIELLASQSVRSAVVLGGGPLGLEWAHGLHERGVKVHLLERSPRLMGNVLDDVCSDLLVARLRSAGIEVHVGEQVVQAYPNQNGAVGAIGTQSGKTIPCDLVAVAFGVEANSEFLATSDVLLDERRRVCTDNSMRTSVPNVWAAGDVAIVDGNSFGLWEPAKRQAHVAAQNMVGKRATFAMFPHYMSTRLFDLDFASVGHTKPSGSTELLLDFPQGTGSIAYKKLVLEQGKLVGAQMLGQRSTRVRRNGRAFARLIQSGLDVSGVRSKLLMDEFDVLGWLETQRLFERPKAPDKQRKLINLAKLKGTQALDLKSVVAPPTASAQGGTRVIQARQTRMLSIGLAAEAAPPANMSGAPIDARLEYQGTQWPLTGAVVRIGSAPDSEFRLAGIGQLHAEITRHGRQVYLRDMGSRSGTRVNGAVVTVPHPLADGDQIQIEQHSITFRSTELGQTRMIQRLGGPTSLGLSVLSGKSLGLSFALGSHPVTIGSGPSCQLRLTEPSVAREHALVTVAQGQHALTDLGSPAGTRLAGHLLSPHQSVLLAPESTFSVGSVEIRYGLRSAGETRLFAVTARLIIDRGQERGRVYTIDERAFVGSAPDCEVTVAGVFPRHLEIVRHGLDFYVRDVSGQARSFRSGTPLGNEFALLSSGELLLLGSEVILRFEEDV